MVDTRDRIIEATAALLEAQGFHGTGLNQIVRESGAPKGSLYYYFPGGKEELVSAAVVWSGSAAADRIRDVMAPHATGADALRSVVLTIAQSMRESDYRTGSPVASVALEMAAESDVVSDACSAVYDLWQGVVRDKLVALGHDRGQATRLAISIVAALEGAVVLSRASRSVLPLEHVARDLSLLLPDADRRSERAAPVSRLAPTSEQPIAENTAPAAIGAMSEAPESDTRPSDGADSVRPATLPPAEKRPQTEAVPGVIPASEQIAPPAQGTEPLGHEAEALPKDVAPMADDVAPLVKDVKPLSAHASPIDRDVTPSAAPTNLAAPESAEPRQRGAPRSARPSPERERPTEAKPVAVSEPQEMVREPLVRRRGSTPSLRVVIFGAAERTGSLLVEQALAAGHSVIAFVSDQTAIWAKHPNLTVVEGDLSDRGAVSRAILGADAALCGLDHAEGSGRYVLSLGVRNIVEAMTVHEVSRLIFLASADMVSPDDARPARGSLLQSLRRAVAGRSLRDAERTVQIIRSSTLDWIIVRVPRMTGGDHTGRYRAGDLEVTSRSQISRADAADFMVRLLVDDTYVRDVPAITY